MHLYMYNIYIYVFIQTRINTYVNMKFKWFIWNQFFRNLAQEGNQLGSKNQIFEVVHFAYIVDECIASSCFNSDKDFFTRNLAIFRNFLDYLSATVSGYQYRYQGKNKEKNSLLKLAILYNKNLLSGLYCTITVTVFSTADCFNIRAAWS